MASFTKLFSIRNGVATRMAGAMNQAKMVSAEGVATALTAMSSKKVLVSLRGAVIAPAPAALLRSSVRCCAASNDPDIVELQLKVSMFNCTLVALNFPHPQLPAVTLRLSNYFTC